MEIADNLKMLISNSNKIGSFSETDMEEAVRLVVQDGWSVRQAAPEKGMSFQTVARYDSSLYMSLDIFFDVSHNCQLQFLFSCSHTGT
jgi:hypothetical protein